MNITNAREFEERQLLQSSMAESGSTSSFVAMVACNLALFLMVLA